MPTWFDFWAPALTTSTFLAIAGFVLGVVWKAAVEKEIQHGFDKKLENLKGEIRADEERLKARLRQADDQLQSLRSGALANLAVRHADLGKRRLDAAEKVWAATLEMDPFRMAAGISQKINIEEVLKGKATTEREKAGMAGMADIILKMSGLTEPPKLAIKPDPERLHVDLAVWALFKAYRQIVMYPFIILTAMKNRVDMSMIADPKPLIDLAKAALPHQAVNIDKFGVGFLTHMPDELQEKLFNAIRTSMAGSEQDGETIANAANILKKSVLVDQAAGKRVDVPAGLAAFSDSGSASK